MKKYLNGVLVDMNDAEVAALEADRAASADRPAPVPASVSNFQARAVMRQYRMLDGRSLFASVDGDLRSAVDATRTLDEFDAARIEADLNWQAWEQANTYDRFGAITQMLAKRYELPDIVTDELFREAEKVTA